MQLDHATPSKKIMASLDKKESSNACQNKLVEGHMRAPKNFGTLRSG